MLLPRILWKEIKPDTGEVARIRIRKGTALIVQQSGEAKAYSPKTPYVYPPIIPTDVTVFDDVALFLKYGPAIMEAMREFRGWEAFEMVVCYTERATSVEIGIVAYAKLVTPEDKS